MGNYILLLNRQETSSLRNVKNNGGALAMAKNKVEKAREEIKNLQEFIKLTESYQADTPERYIIREYAYYSSIPIVIKSLREKGITKEGKEIERKDVLDVIKAKPVDDLHRIIQSWYKLKVKGNKVKEEPKPRRNRKLAMLNYLKSIKQ
ncbi:hypothetical protein [Neobacillus sp. YIM B06451]|uniref:hypothetical protein n=1 Tax=Neobacillus sp. YIM B06451 TaxID=3070994 RepID=UPI00292CACCE|nr:hypothetical protein [Neobacillus sp. YIM B06451]